MKQVLLIGGPCDGRVRMVNDHARALFADDKRVRYVEVPFLDQVPYSVFRLDSIPPRNVLPILLDYYAKGHPQS